MSIIGLNKCALLTLFSIACFFSIVAVKAQSPEDLIINKRERNTRPLRRLVTRSDLSKLLLTRLLILIRVLKQRTTGIKEFRDYLSSFNGTFSFPGYELLNPQVQLYSDIGILTFNFVGYSKDDKKDYWNATEVYRLIKGEWKLASSHWSHTKPK